ncbi:MAG: hypothetical protein V3V00_11680 [Saprospiraceae bacterium]
MLQNNRKSLNPKEKMQDIWLFEKSPPFTDLERSALRFGIASGATPNAVNEEYFFDLKKHYTQDQIVELGAIISLFGFLNR